MVWFFIIERKNDAYKDDATDITLDNFIIF